MRFTLSTEGGSASYIDTKMKKLYILINLSNVALTLETSKYVRLFLVNT